MRTATKVVLSLVLSISPASGGAAAPGPALENARISVVLHREVGRAVLSFKRGGEVREAVQIIPAAGGKPAERFTTVSTEAAGTREMSVAVEGVVDGGKPFSLRLRVLGDGPILECQTIAGIDRLGLAYLSPHAILPELFGDDLVLRAGESGERPRVLPAEHAVLHPIDRGDALLLASWPPGVKEVEVRKGAVEGRPAFVETDLPCSGPERIWISVLAGKAIWHETEAARFSFSEYKTLDWKPPFPARYRADLRREGPWALTDSWVRQPTRSKFWMAFLGNGFPPLCMNGDEAAFRLPRFRPGLPFPKDLPPEIQYTGPILIYPFRGEADASKVKAPDGAWTVLDVLRATLGEDWTRTLDIGEGVLEPEPFPEGFVFLATCTATGKAEELFAKGKEKEEAGAIRSAFDDMNLFVSYHRTRIEEYLALAGGWRKMLDDRARALAPSPELKQAVADLDPLLAYFGDLFEESRDAIKSPAKCKGLTEEALALIERQDPDRVARMKGLGVAMRKIGGRQDDILCCFRMAAKALRQRAGQIHAASTDPAVRSLMRDLRLATRAALRTCSPYEEFLFLTASKVVEKQ